MFEEELEEMRKDIERGDESLTLRVKKEKESNQIIAKEKAFLIPEIGSFIESLRNSSKKRKSMDKIYNFEDSMAANREYLSFENACKAEIDSYRNVKQLYDS
jgi:hypothetical protein